MTLATVGNDGQPTARIVLLKSFSKHGFIFYTNYESKKGRQMKENNKVALLFWWAERQVRIEGTVKKVDKKTAVQAFITSFKKFPLSKSVFDQYKEKGVKALSGYFVRYNKSWNTNVLLEFPIGGVFSKGAIRLTGKLDKIEFLGSGNEVNVVDYKTGKHHSRNHLEGKTKSGTGNEKRQLIFYKLLLDLFSKNRFNMTTGLIDFVEPDERGVYHREQFVITPEDTEALSILLEEKVAEILSFSFWNTTCEKKDCEFCALRKLTGAQLVEK
jgi:CRISPR/Cas system-associated exonuclease Cas4 (RecB family)/uncharacterized pyridoxamine 5'-phosphate oxidase family protein